MNPEQALDLVIGGTAFMIGAVIVFIIMIIVLFNKKKKWIQAGYDHGFEDYPKVMKEKLTEEEKKDMDDVTQFFENN